MEGFSRRVAGWIVAVEGGEEEVKAGAVYLFTIDTLDLPVSAVVQLTSFNRLLHIIIE